MNRSILVQRASVHKDGWKLRFDQGALIASVVVAGNGKKVNLINANQARRAGGR